MALKSFNELIKIDVRPQCDTRDAKDENGKTIKVPYLSWGKCVKLLHENGANDVWYAPVECPTTHTYLWPQAKVSTSKGAIRNAGLCGCCSTLTIWNLYTIRRC